MFRLCVVFCCSGTWTRSLTVSARSLPCFVSQLHEKKIVWVLFPSPSFKVQSQVCTHAWRRLHVTCLRVSLFLTGKEETLGTVTVQYRSHMSPNFHMPLNPSRAHSMFVWFMRGLERTWKFRWQHSYHWV